MKTQRTHPIRVPSSQTHARGFWAIVRKILILWSPPVGRFGWEEQTAAGHWEYSVTGWQSQVWEGGRQSWQVLESTTRWNLHYCSFLIWTQVLAQHGLHEGFALSSWVPPLRNLFVPGVTRVISLPWIFDFTLERKLSESGWGARRLGILCFCLLPETTPSG